MSDVLLLHPSEQGKTFGGMPPLGMAWITSYLRSKGVSAALVDLQVSDVSVGTLLQLHKPKIVGIGGTSHTRFESFKIAHHVKAYDSAICVVYGGSHASFTGIDTLRRVSDIDFVVRGEGEFSMHEIVSRVLKGSSDFAGILGISYRQNDEIIHNSEAERIKDLDILPFPYRDPDAILRYNLFLDFLHVPAASVVSSRGCPVNCSFCSASAMFGTQLTFRSAKNVLDEIEQLIREHRYQGIKFFDSTLTLKRSHIEALCMEIQRRKIKFPWECEIRVNGMSYDLLRTMRDAGCYYVDFGVESANPSVLKTMHKGITLEQVINVFHWTKDLGMFTKVFFTFGHIGETIEDARTTVRFMEKNAKYITVAATGIGVRIYPGTEVESVGREKGFLGKDFSWSLPFIDQNIESLGNDPLIPILIQPQFGWHEFRKIEFRLVRFWLKNPIKALRALWSMIKLGRGAMLLHLVLRFIRIHILRTNV